MSLTRSARLARAGSAAVCSCTALLLGCGSPLCPSTTFSADIAVDLGPGWTAVEDLVVTVGCPPDAECGFLDGPVRAPAIRSVMISTVLRPPEVEVTISRLASGDLVTRARLPVSYQPFGPVQTECGGDARALVVVPSD